MSEEVKKPAQITLVFNDTDELSPEFIEAITNLVRVTFARQHQGPMPFSWLLQIIESAIKSIIRDMIEKEYGAQIKSVAENIVTREQLSEIFTRAFEERVASYFPSLDEY